MNKVQTALLLGIAGLIFGCGPATLNKAEQRGKTTLDARAIFNLVSDNTLSLSAYDFAATLFFDKDGGLAGLDNARQSDSGTWDIKENDQLCLKFKIWYYGDVRCYSVVQENQQDQISFFTPNGAAYYSGSLKPGDPYGLRKNIATRQPSTFIRQKIAEEQKKKTKTEDSQGSTGVAPDPKNYNPADTNNTVRQLAKNCPGCNFAGADLKEANLIKANLEGANLANADLRYANLRRAKLSGADLSGARLNHANMPGADLRNTNLRNADLSGANLLLADFTGADLSGVDLSNTHIENTKGIER